MQRFCAFVLFALSVLACNAGGQWEENNFAADDAAPKGHTMASPVTAGDYGGSLPLTSIQCPNDNDDVVGADLRAPVAALLAETDDIRSITTGLENDKVDRAGDTMTDSLTVNASTADNDAITGTGDGSGFGVKGIGGATGGGGRFIGTGNGSTGVSAVGGPSGGSGIVATGGTGGLAAELYPGTAQTGATAQMGVYAEGYLRLAGTQINAFVDPGANNVLHGANIPKARGRAYLGGVPPYAFVGTPYGFTSTLAVTGAGTTRFTMIRAMADTNYEVHAQIHGAVGYAVSETNIGARTTTSFELTVFSTTTGTPGVGPAQYLDILVMGKQ
jgi:hypothetical protein